jgi:hypothetical protein
MPLTGAKAENFETGLLKYVFLGDAANVHTGSNLYVGLFTSNGTDPPLADTSLNHSPRPIFLVPSKSKCSKKWAKPVRSLFSFFEPTWYNKDVTTIGTVLFWCKITCNPLSKLNS